MKKIFMIMFFLTSFTIQAMQVFHDLNDPCSYEKLINQIMEVIEDEGAINELIEMWNRKCPHQPINEIIITTRAKNKRFDNSWGPAL